MNLYNPIIHKGVMLLLKNLLMTIAAILALGFVLYLIPMSAQNLTDNRTDTTGFSQNNSIRNLENPVLKMEKNPWQIFQIL